ETLRQEHRGVERLGPFDLRIVMWVAVERFAGSSGAGQENELRLVAPQEQTARDKWVAWGVVFQSRLDIPEGEDLQARLEIALDLPNDARSIGKFVEDLGEVMVFRGNGDAEPAVFLVNRAVPV